MNRTTPPPTKLSDLIELAIGDARRLDRSVYVPSWKQWHEPRKPKARDGNAPATSETPKCLVYLAGAVIAGTLGYAPENTVDIAEPEQAKADTMTVPDVKWKSALWALDWIREGQWTDGFLALHGWYPKDKKLHDALLTMESPGCARFHDWETLNRHLESLSERADELRRLGL